MLLLSSPAFAAYEGLVAGELADRVVAKVNTTAITLSELEEAVVERRMADPEARAKAPRELFEEELSRLIDDELIYQAATQAGVEAPPEMIAARVSEVIAALEQAIGSREKLEEALKEHGMTLEKFQQRVRRSEARQIVIARAIASRITITESDVDEFETQLHAMGSPATGYLLRHILIQCPKDAPPSDVRAARERAFQAALKAQSEMTFAEAAKKYSQDEATRAKGGDLGYVPEGSMMPELEQAVKALQIGEISQPARSDTGWHVFKLENVRSPRKLLFAKRFEEERQSMLAQLRRTMTIETQMEFLEEIPE